jgi:SET domain-containing protein
MIWETELQRTQNPNTASFSVRRRDFLNGQTPQKGLYALHTIEKGELVVGMDFNKLKYITSKENLVEVESDLIARNQPTDVIIHMPGQRPKAVYETFDHKDPQATGTYWYYMNHSRSNANVFMRMLKDKHDKFVTIGFRAKRKIIEDEELLFDYKEPDLSWEE